VAHHDPEVRRLLAQQAAYARHAKVPKPAPPVVPKHLRDRYETQVDPSGALDLDERQKRAYRAWKRDESLRAARARKQELKALLGSGRPVGDDDGPRAA
jgi:hypothetical protein